MQQLNVPEGIDAIPFANLHVQKHLRYFHTTFQEETFLELSAREVVNGPTHSPAAIVSLLPYYLA